MTAEREPIPNLVWIIPAAVALFAVWLLAGVLVLIGTVVLVLVLIVFVKSTLLSSHRVRRMWWRIKLRLRPGPGFASVWEIHFRHSRFAALRHGRRARPSMKLRHRATSRTTRFAVRQGRAQYGRAVYTRAEDQEIVVAPPRLGKSGVLGDRLIEHDGPAVVTSYPDIYAATAGYRHDLGPIQVFNPENLGNIPSTFKWGMTLGCADPAEALRRASDLVGAVVTAGEMQWWAEKSATALAAGMHAADLLGGDMGDVWAWSNGHGYGTVEEASRAPGASVQLFGSLSELERPGKTADSIRLTMSKSLQWLAVPQIRDMVTGDAGVFDVASFVRDKGTVYMLAPGGDGTPEAALFRCFASYLHRAARREGLSMPSHKLDPGLLFALDELHICPVALPEWLADSAGHGIQVVAVVHSTGQLRDKYGEDGAATVWSTAGTKLFLPGIHDMNTLEDVSKLCGTLGRSGPDSERVIPPELLAQLPDWRALLISVNRSPVVVKFRPHWHRLDVRLHRAPAVPYVSPEVQPPNVIELPRNTRDEGDISA